MDFELGICQRYIHEQVLWSQGNTKSWGSEIGGYPLCIRTCWILGSEREGAEEKGGSNWDLRDQQFSYIPMCIAEVQKDFTKGTGFSNIRSLRIQFLNFHTHSFLKRISLRTQVKTFCFSPPLDLQLQFYRLMTQSWISYFLQFGSSVLEGTGARGLVFRGGWYYLQQVEGSAVTQGKLEPQCLLRPLRLYEHHEVRSFFSTMCYPQ